MASSASPAPSPIVLIPQDGEPWSALLQRMREAEGHALLLLAGKEGELIDRPVLRDSFVQACAEQNGTLTVATRHPVILAELRKAGVPVVDHARALRTLLEEHPALPEALRIFSPHLWKQQLTSRLQRLGLLSMPRLRIFGLAGLSAILFYVVVFRLLPSAEIVVHPRQEPATQTVNIFLATGTGAAAGANRVRTLPLLPLLVELERTIRFDQISKEFTGTAARVRLTVINTAPEPYSLRAGTRFSNQAGMIFRSTSSLNVEPGQEAVVEAVADPTDVFGQIIGERGNVPEGVKWQIPGLSEPERALVYAENREPASGGTTSYVRVLKPEDLEVARKRLEQELLTAAREEVDRRVGALQRRQPGSSMELLRYDQLTDIAYVDVRMPSAQIGTQADAVDVTGSIRFRMFAYDAAQIFPLLLHELRGHVREGRRLVETNLDPSHLVVHVIDYAADRSWIKLTVDLSAAEQYVLDPLQPAGALFARRVRELVAGRDREEALRIIRNLPEVETASISQWPPWSRTLPRIGSHIAIVPR